MGDAPPAKYGTTCRVCRRTRRPDRALCNRCIRHSGPQTAERYFLRARAAKNQAADSDAVTRLGAVIDEMMANARAYDAIRAEGHRPFWNASRAIWEHPVARTQGILEHFVRNHRFGLDPDNDRHVCGVIAHEIHPPERKR